jgi:lipid-A-disaccharide synthase
MKILISAAETSSDAHAAQLLLALKKQCDLRGEPLEAFGIGGPQLAKAGLDISVDARELLSMGFLEIASRLPKIFHSLSRLEQEAAKRKPDVAVVLDYPDFHFRLAKRLKLQGVPVVYYIPPKVWAWRKGRVRFLKKFFAKILCIFPFEEAFYSDEKIPVEYVGNPLLDELPLSSSKKDAREKLKIATSEKVLAVLPGSRPAELKHHLELFLDGAQLSATQLLATGILGDKERLTVLLPFPLTSELEPLQKRVHSWECEQRHLMLQIRISQGDSAWALLASDFGLIKSGTSTLESALLGCPHVIVYKTNRLTEFLVRQVINYWGPIGLSNLVAGAKKEPFPIPELTGKEVTARTLAKVLTGFFQEGALAKEVREVCLKVRQLMVAGREGISPSETAAKEILKVARIDSGRDK